VNIEKFRNKQGKIWLNVASSVYALAEFVNLDNSVFLQFSDILYILRPLIPGKYHEWITKYKNLKKSKLFLIHDCRKPLPFPNSSVDHVLCSDFLEHVFPKEAEEIVGDFHRVLKDGGTLHIVVPNLTWMVEEYLEKKKSKTSNAADWFIAETILSRKTRGSLKYRILEFFGAFGLQHYWMYDDDSMKMLLDKFGFKIVEEKNFPSKNYRAGIDYKSKAVEVFAQK